MAEILQGKPSFAQSIASSLGGGLGAGISQGAQFAQQMQLQQAKMKKEQDMSKALMGQQAQQSIDTLRNLVGQKGVGFSGRFNFSDEAQRNKGNFSALTASVLPAFKQMFPRGFTEKEFRIIREEYIPQVGDRESTIQGKLDGLESMFQTLASGGDWNQAIQNASSVKESEEPSGESKSAEKFVHMRDPAGNLRKVSSNDIKAAKKAGYKTVR